MFFNQTQEGLDNILLRKVKQSWGGRKCWPRSRYKPRTNGVKPYTAPDTMRKRKADRAAAGR